MPLEEITPGVACLPTLMANIYMVGEPGGSWALVDTGTPGHAALIREAARQRYGPDARPTAILLTHGHNDHAGSARELADAWDVPVYAHRLERPFLTGKSTYPPKDPQAGGAFAFLCRFFPSPTHDMGDRLTDLPEGGEVPGLAGWRWHFTPGHAPGHVVFFEPEALTLLAGDACTTIDLDSAVGIATQQPRISRPPAAFTYDWEQARRSVELMEAMHPRVIGAGHGEPMKGPAVAAGLTHLVRHFPKPRGRYALESARTDENGVAYVPAAPADPLPKMATAVGLAAVAIAGVVALSRRKR